MSVTARRTKEMAESFMKKGHKVSVITSFPRSTRTMPGYKTKYYNPGEIIFDPPYATTLTTNNVIRSGGDKVSKVYLGVSDSSGAGYDADFFDYKGQIPPTSI